ncbi:MAG: aminotransferase class III-fold pyridoxal phosphate-dependent enzyme [Leptospirales bacterium]|jgi:acetylornithine/succinyldiaminopimelate/putrescine aminotransferase/predicted amino acid dehydrogenase
MNTQEQVRPLDINATQVRQSPNHTNGLSSNDAQAKDDFQTYLRPLLGRLMHALRLDIEFDYAFEDTLEFTNERGERSRVYDFLGGYGALIFGHNDPELTRTAMDVLQQRRPFGAQASLRSYAARLGRKLSEMFEQRFERPYVTTLANSGTEAVEVAIKHSRLSHLKRKQALVENIETAILKLRNRGDCIDLPVAPETARHIQRRLPDAIINSFDDLVQAVRRLNQQELAAPSVYCSLKNAYHGKTTGAVNLTASAQYRAAFSSAMGPRVVFVDREDPAHFEHEIEENALTFYSIRSSVRNGDPESRKVLIAEPIFMSNIAALFVEPIQGEGGINIIDAAFLRDVRRLCDEHIIHLVFDEIQCGMGRTGTFLFSERSGVCADYYLLSKSLGGGLAKISSTSVRRDFYEEEFSVMHTSTFAEDDFSSAVALRSLELLEERPEIMRDCERIGGDIKTSLKALQRKYPEIIRAVRGEGLMLAIHFFEFNDADSQGFRVLAESDLIGFAYAGYLLHEHGVRVAPTLSNNNVLRLEPPACVSPAALEELYAGVDRLCRILRHQNFYELVRYVVGKERSGESPGGHGPVQDYRGTYYKTPLDNDIERTVGFIVHFVDETNVQTFDSSCENFSLEEVNRLLDRCYLFLKPFRMMPKTIYSKTGKKIRLQPVGLPITSAIIQRHMEGRDMKPMVDLCEQAIDKVVADRISIMGFGGFSSIIMQNCKAVRNESLSVTTGNSLTVGMGYKALLKAADDLRIDLNQACFAAIGATGNIGIVYSELMIAKVPELILVGRPGRESALEAVAARLYAAAFFEAILSDDVLDHAVANRIRETRAVQELLASGETRRADADRDAIGRRLYAEIARDFETRGERAPITVSVDPADVRRANLILGASNQSGSLIKPDFLRPDAVVICDVALPADTDPEVFEKRPDVLVIKGGEVKVAPVPAAVAEANAHTGARDFKLEGVPIRPDHMFACMTEAVLMGLTGIESDYSKGDVQKNRVREILEIASLHGFELGALKTGRSF